ncbi:MAG: protein kinase, partial [Candidatus Obscuribacterales bacterium]|nr:protein kinase [Candidatus Obscuribacterales bacterium]
ESLVAKGSMGVIYKATQEAIGRTVAIKVMHGYLVSDDESLKRYHKEAKAASRLNHPNITAIYDFGVLASGQPYIVMDLLQGKALADTLHERGQLTVGQTMMVMNQVCQALGEAHARGVVHRDIKPENIVIEELPDGKGIHVKVVDFGIATFSAEGADTIGKITKTGTVCGSPFYMSPEQCDAGKTDQRSDLYSLGIVLFECLTGKVPFESKDIYSVLSMQVKDPPPRLNKVRPDLDFSTELESMVAKALAKNPDARYQSAKEFWEALAEAGGLRGGKKPTTPVGARIPVAGPEPLNQNIAEEPIDPEALRKKIQEATGALQEKADRAKAQLEAKKRGRKRGVSPFDQAIALLQIIVPPVLTLIVTAALFWVIANQSIVHTLLAKTGVGIDPAATVITSPSKANVETLIAQEKLEDAKALLDQKKKEGSLSANDQDNFDWICIKLARREVKAKRYSKAQALLDQLSAESKDEDDVKALFKKCKKQAK